MSGSQITSAPLVFGERAVIETISNQNEQQRTHAVRTQEPAGVYVQGSAFKAAGRHPRISVQIYGRDDPIQRRRRSEGHQGGRLRLWRAVG